jgi:hypothetical protein
VAISKEIQCTFCGLRGEIERPGTEDKQRGRKVFRHLGHNPFSGHLHYQCPSCSIVLLVLPMDILEGRSLQGIPDPQPRMKPLQTAFMEMLAPFKALRRLFLNPLFPAAAGIQGMRHPDAHIDRGGT